MTDYSKNLRKRIIFVVAGIVVSYLSVVPLGLLFHQYSSEPLLNPVMSYFFFNVMRIGIFVLFLYLAFIRVKPSLVPQQKKYQIWIIISILLITTLSIVLPSGYVIPQWEQGACVTKSGMYGDDGILFGSTSQGITTEPECIQNCIFSGNFNTREEKFCEFNGMFGKTYWMKTPDEITMDYKPVFQEIIK